MFEFFRQKKLFGDAFWALFGQLGSALALLIGTRMLTELVSPNVFGQVALLNGFVALGVSVFSYPFICAGMRMVSECHNPEARNALFAAVTSWSSRAIFISIVILISGGLAYGYFTHHEFGPFLMAGILLGVTFRRELGVQLLIGERRQRDASFWQTTDSILRPLLAIAMVWCLGAKAEWLILGYILASLISNILWTQIHAHNSDNVAKPSLQQVEKFKQVVWLYAVPLIPMELVFWLNGLGDRYVIGFLMTAEDVGLYAASYTIINEAFSRSAMILLRTFQPVYFQAVSAHQRLEGFSILWLWISCVLGLGIIGVILLYFTKDWVATLLLAQSYHSAIELFPAIAVGSALHALGTVMGQPLLAAKRTRSLLKGRVCGALTAAISIPLMVQHYGLQGAAMANPIYYGVEMLVLALLAKPWQVVNCEESVAIDTSLVAAVDEEMQSLGLSQ